MALESLADCSATIAGIPRDYALLLVGGLVGLMTGALAAKLGGKPSGPEPSVPDVVASPPPAEPGLNLVVNGQRLDLAPQVLAELHGLIRDRRKAEAVKCLREASGLGPAEAKAVVESLETVVRQSEP